MTKSKQKVKPRGVKSVLNDLNIKTYLEHIYRRFVIVTIDKAPKNFSLFCKKIDIIELLSEVGLSGDTPNKTFSCFNHQRRNCKCQPYLL